MSGVFNPHSRSPRTASRPGSTSGSSTTTQSRIPVKASPEASEEDFLFAVSGIQAFVDADLKRESDTPSKGLLVLPKHSHNQAINLIKQRRFIQQG